MATDNLMLEEVTIKFAGDSGDGMQLSGNLFTDNTALTGSDLATYPDFPAEIRAPAGTLAGVSGFQIHFSSSEIYTPGDKVDVLGAMNAAALKANLGNLEEGGTIIVSSDGFDSKNLRLAKYDINPLEDGSLAGFQLFDIPITKLTRETLADSPLGTKEKDRCKNMFVLGFLYWRYNRNLEDTVAYLNGKFGKKPDILDANLRVLKAGYHFGDTTETFMTRYTVEAAPLEKGTYRGIMGNEAVVLGLVAASKKSGLPLFYASYPITPASDILHGLAPLKHYGVKTFQAEDEIAAISAAIGASYGGNLAITGTSGPGLALKGEALGLAMMLELPLVVLNIQRGGPSTGLPTKTEQSDLLQALYGRNGESPVVVIAAATPSDAFDVAFEACRIALQHMTPVILLSDGPLGHAITWALVAIQRATGAGYGWVLILFGVLIRVVLWPLNAKAMRSQLKTMELQPRIKDLQTRYKSEPEKMQKEMLRLYKEEGFNPMGGCLPMLIPFPILIALFFVFQSTIELRGAEFMWLPDLSQPDPIYALPVLLGVSMFLLQWLNLRAAPAGAQQTQMKVMMYVMPVFMTFLFLNFASGLNLYYASMNFASLPQQLQIIKERRAWHAAKQTKEP
jgi:YidC/Oxa1 family membrane protein insertase